MNKDELIQQIALVINALNRVSVMGKSNLANLSGSITVLEEIAQLMEKMELAAPEQTTEKKA